MVGKVVFSSKQRKNNFSNGNKIKLLQIGMGFVNEQVV
jgi:hypothetical protein